MKTTIAFLVPNCPNFYFSPSKFYDRIFMEYGDVTNKSSPAYWKSRGYIIIELEDSTYEECDYVLFVYQNKSCIFSAGDTARRELGEAYLKLQKASKQLYNDILFVSKKV